MTDDKTTSAPVSGLQSTVSSDPWEAAYLRFETPEQEIRKFAARLRRMGADRWPRDSEIVELFCGRGNGLRALEQLGFTRIEGVDLSPRLLEQYTGPAKCILADCRQLPFSDRSKDVLIVQGGLHHLPALPGNLDETFAEMRRVVRKDGLVMIVEPWLTPFLRVVHWVSERWLARRASAKLEALATMIEHERRTYEQWLSQPGLILGLARTHFSPVHDSFAWGKWNFVGRPRCRMRRHCSAVPAIAACILPRRRYDGGVSNALLRLHIV